MSEDELALEILKGRVRDRDAEIAALRAEVERLAGILQMQHIDHKAEVERADAALAEARAVVRLAYEDEMCPQVHDMTVEEWDEWLVRAAAVLKKAEVP